MDEIVKVCKIHGNLSAKEVYIIKRNKSNLCKKCAYERSLKYYKSSDKAKKTKKECDRKWYLKNKEKSNLQSKEYIKNNRESSTRRNRNYHGLIRKQLRDVYIKKCIIQKQRIPMSIIPKSLVELKRTLILIKREMESINGYS